MKIKIGQLHSFIVTRKHGAVILFGVESTRCSCTTGEKDFPFITNTREIKDEQWFNTLTTLYLTDLFYHEKTGLFRKDADISPLYSEHLMLINNAHDLFFDVYGELIKTEPARVGADGILVQNSHTPEAYMAGEIKWLRFWMHYAVNFCSQPVIANTESIEIGKTTNQQYAGG